LLPANDIGQRHLDGLAAERGLGDEPFLNRELSWLEFNRRVLAQALDGDVPLLERLRFLAIFSSNLDEFFMKRVGGLKRQEAAGVSAHGHRPAPAQQLALIRRAVLPMLAVQARCFGMELRPALATRGIHLLDWHELSPAEQNAAGSYYKANVFPVLTPLAVDPGHPFPFISNLSTSLGVRLCHPGIEGDLFARVKVPAMLPAWIPLANDGERGAHRLVSLIELLRHNLGDLFPGLTVRNVTPFRITRNADVERDEEDADDLLELIEEELRQRRTEQVVRLELGPDPDPRMARFLRQELGLDERDVYVLPGLLDHTGLQCVADLTIPALRYPPWTPLVPPELATSNEDIFALIRRGDLLVHHPYDSFGASVERFIAAAAADPEVLAIKMAVYRTGNDSPFIDTLIRAARDGKQAICLLELKARFDEQRNIASAQALEAAGVHVVYGLMGLKTHTKTALVVRREPDGLRCYAHVGTGNYHMQTARLYTDLGLLTCRPELTGELMELFNHLTGRAIPHGFHHLLVAPLGMKERFLELIEREIAHQECGRPAAIVAKMNSLEDHDIIRALYRASGAGVPIDLIVRGFCCLRPGVPGRSSNIRVVSVVGRFLEHSRIFHFRNGAADPVDGEYFIGSADWMYRNLQARVEAVAPILAPAHRRRCWEILQVMLADRRLAWDLQPDGDYEPRRPGPDDTGSAALGTHQVLMDLARRRAGAPAAPDEAGANTIL
jgi:polyphosphate kinase